LKLQQMIHPVVAAVVIRMLKLQLDNSFLFF
jgi:hypothetical protein